MDISISDYLQSFLGLPQLKPNLNERDFLGIESNILCDASYT